MGIQKIIRPFRRHGADWRQATHLWGGLGSAKPVIVIPADLRNEHDPATGTGELRAAALVLLGSAVLRAKDFIIVYPHELVPYGEEPSKELLSETLGNADVVLLGSEITNSISELAFKLLAKGDPWLLNTSGRDEESSNHWVAYRDGVRYTTEYFGKKDRSPHTMSADYGIFVVRPNCFAKSSLPDGRIFIFYGAHTHGTQAAADFFFSDEGAAKIARTYKGKDRIDWKYFVDGLVKVSPYATNDRSEQIGVLLTERDRNIELLAPEQMAGHKIVNPVMGRMLSKAQASLWKGITRKVEFRSLCITATLLFAFGVYAHNGWLALSGVLLYVIFRKVYQHNV